MSRETRTVLLLMAFALGGVSALAYMAHRYGQILEHPQRESQVVVGSSESRDVESFVAVRRAIKESIDARRGEAVDAALIRVARGRGLALASMTIDRYRAVRESYRAWKRGALEQDDSMRALFDSRRAELLQIDLGRYESLDS